MWPRDLIRLPSLLVELSLLLREQNSLLRELVQYHTRRPAQTPATASSPQFHPRPPLRQYTKDDVFQVTPARRAELDLIDQAKRELGREPISMPAEPTFDRPLDR